MIGLGLLNLNLFIQEKGDFLEAEGCLSLSLGRVSVVIACGRLGGHRPERESSHLMFSVLFSVPLMTLSKIVELVDVLLQFRAHVLDDLVLHFFFFVAECFENSLMDLHKILALVFPRAMSAGVGVLTHAGCPIRT